jgi:hypothetical protein
LRSEDEINLIINCGWIENTDKKLDMILKKLRKSSIADLLRIRIGLDKYDEDYQFRA